MITWQDLPFPEGVTVIEYPGREAWLDARYQQPWRIGASEVSALFGENTYLSPFALAQSKLGNKLDAKDKKLARRGHLYEKAIAQDAIDEMNDEAGEGIRYELVWLPEWCGIVNTQYPSLAATPDAMVVCWEQGEPVQPYDPGWMLLSTDSGPEWHKLLWFGPKEVKRVRWPMRDQWEGEPPVGYQVQLQVQMMCCGCDKGIIAGSIGDELNVTQIDRFDPLCAIIVESTETFLTNLAAGILPPPDGSEPTTRALNAFYRAKGDTPIDLPSDLWDLPLELERAKEECKAAEERKDALSNRLKMALGTNTVATYPGGTISWKEQTKKEHPVKEATFRVLRVSQTKEK